MQSKTLTKPAIYPPQKPIKAEHVLAFDWRGLTALGVTPEDARSIATTLIAKRLMLIYWRRLHRAGIPYQDAKRIARAVAKYDVMEMLPSARQQTLIGRYCPIVCRVGLWRRELLLTRR